VSSVLIINGVKPFLISKGELNNTFATLVAEHFAALATRRYQRTS
jgi:modulator of drug activity B